MHQTTTVTPMMTTIKVQSSSTQIMDNTGEEKYNHRMITGDYNVALKHDIDTSGYLHVNNPNTREFLTKQAHLSNLIDIWRVRNPNSRQYTFHKRQAKNYTRARLDYYLVSENSSEYIKDVQIGRVCSLSDHRPIHLQMSFSKIQKGK